MGFFVFCLSIFIYFYEYESIVKSSASSFGHSDPNPSSMKLYEPMYKQVWKEYFDLFSKKTMKRFTDAMYVECK